MGRKTFITAQHDSITLINIEGDIKETQLQLKQRISIPHLVIVT